MTKNRFFIKTPFQQDTEIQIPKDELSHFKVLRVREGETIEMVNGRGELAKALYKGGKTLHIQEVTTKAPQPHQSTIIQAMTEGSHLDYIIEKGCEIGVTHFILFPSKKSRKQSLSANKIARINKLLISALKQSRRLHLPNLSLLNSIEDLKQLPENLYLADPNGKPLMHTPNKDCGFLVGPESGFTDDEIIYLTTVLKAEKISLSENVLRTETASMLCAFLLTQKQT